MANTNAILAAQIILSLQENKLVKLEDRQLVTKLATGQMKESDWKIALEEMINLKVPQIKGGTNEA